MTNRNSSILFTEDQDALLQSLPASVREWILFEHYEDIDPQQLKKFADAGATPRQILQGLRLLQYANTKKTWGGSHPQSKYA